MIRKILMAVAIMLPAVFGASAQSTLKIGLVDVTAIVQIMPETTEAQNKIGDTSKKYEAEYQKLLEEMKRLYDEVNNMKETELPAIRERKINEFQSYQQKVQSFEQSAQNDLQQKQQELMAPIYQKVKNAVEAVGREGGFSLIETLEPQLQLYYAAPVEDITPTVKAKLGLK